MLSVGQKQVSIETFAVTDLQKHWKRNIYQNIEHTVEAIAGPLTRLNGNVSFLDARMVLQLPPQCFYE